MVVSFVYFYFIFHVYWALMCARFERACVWSKVNVETKREDVKQKSKVLRTEDVKSDTKSIIDFGRV